MNKHEHMEDAVRYSFEVMVESRKNAEKAKQELIQTLKYASCFVAGSTVSSIVWVIFTIFL